jgi:hypothetical protein
MKSFHRFIFLPENSTHLLQPLDVSVFAPMKRKWREILSEWKEECLRNNSTYCTLTKQVMLRDDTGTYLEVTAVPIDP